MDGIPIEPTQGKPLQDSRGRLPRERGDREMKHTRQEIDGAVARSKKIIREAFARYSVEDMAITWTGGKDSGLVLWLIRQVCEEDGLRIPKVMTIDEFDTFDEIHRFMEMHARAWNLQLDWRRNDDVIRAAGGVLNAKV
ncbi:MAG: hypothetical protein AB7V19_07975, partial [Candidatus Bipolaricaulia bacterium]